MHKKENAMKKVTLLSMLFAISIPASFAETLTCRTVEVRGHVRGRDIGEISIEVSSSYLKYVGPTYTLGGFNSDNTDEIVFFNQNDQSEEQLINTIFSCDQRSDGSLNRCFIGTDRINPAAAVSFNFSLNPNRSAKLEYFDGKPIAIFANLGCE
jgi:hypothetical protein